MRVTNKLIADTVTSNLLKKTENLLETQNMIASGKRINKPSDDPHGIAKVMDYRKTLASIDQYAKNISHGKSRLYITDTTLDSVNNLLVRATELAVQMASDTYNEANRKEAAEEVKNIRGQMIQLANTRIGNDYLFAGHETASTPFSSDGTYNGDDGEIRLIIGNNIDIRINATGEEIFQSDVDIFQVLTALEQGLEDNDAAAISAQLPELEEASNHILNEMAKVGAGLNRLEATAYYWDSFKLNVSNMLSHTEDAEITEAITNLATQEAAYKAALSVSASIIQPSLVSLLR